MKHLTTITPFSKYLSMTLFIFLPLATFFLGIIYQNTLTAPLTPNINVDTRTNLIKRCGQISADELAIKLDKSIILNGPDWAPDCRHIAWSIKTENKNASESSVLKGVYLYSDQTKDVKLVAFEKTPQENVTFERWKNSENLVISRNMNKKVTLETISLLKLTK